MSEYAGRQSRTASGSDATRSADPSPGKQTLVEQVAVSDAPVQRHGTGEGAAGDAGVHAAAARGTATSSSALPHGDVIQRMFGRHDVSSVRAHTGPEAAGSARDMGADAYASGNHVVLGDKGSDLFTVAHEAAHVVQQRGGVQLKGGVGAEGDVYERHADEVATNVVQGKSAEGLLDRFAPSSAGAASSGSAATQRKVTVGATLKKRKTGAETATMSDLASAGDVDGAWDEIKDLAPLAGVDAAAAKAVLAQWITRPVPISKRDDLQGSRDQRIKSEDRKYRNWDELARAVAGEVGSAANVEKEAGLASEALAPGAVATGVNSFTVKLLQFHQDNPALKGGEGVKGRYSGWAYGEHEATIGTTLGAVPADVSGRIAFIADYALAMRSGAFEVKGKPKSDWIDQMALGMTGEMEAGRATHHNTDEGSSWVKDARAKNLPMSAGPSATTAQVLTLAVAVGASTEEKTALAWALFGIWNTMPTHQSGTHRFHEVMSVAVGYGVEYTRLEYPSPSGQA